MSSNYKQAVKYCLIYILIFNIVFTVITSVGIFFHFILNHEINIIESWLHLHGWELFIFSKMFSCFLFYKLLQIRLYKVKTVREIWTTYPSFMNQSPYVIGFYLWFCFIFLAKPTVITANLSYFYELLICYVGTTLMYFVDLFVLMILYDTFNLRDEQISWKKYLIFPFLFSLSLFINGQDYYRLMFVSVLNIFTFFVIIGPKLQFKINGLVFLILFASPFASVTGMDFLWGNEYSIFKFNSIPNLSFLLIIWMISWCYNFFSKNVNPILT